MKLIRRIKEGESYYGALISWSFRDRLDYQFKPPTDKGWWFDVVINLGKIHFGFHICTDNFI